MSHDRLPLPPAEACLFRLRSSTQKGGTLIAEDVTDWATHDRRICDPDGYRPRVCPTCGGSRFHVHDYRVRILRAEPTTPVATIVRHLCVACLAIWQVLPALIARHLWRTWRTVAQPLVPDEAPAESWRWPPVPTRTVHRWRARWDRPARALAQILTTSGAVVWATLVGALPAEATCGDLVVAYRRQHGSTMALAVGAVAALVYRLQPRVRLM